MYNLLLKFTASGIIIFLLNSGCAEAKPFRYIGIGGGVNVRGNSDGADTDFHSDNLNAQGTLRIQLPISNNISISNNFFYLKNDPNTLISVNLHLAPKSSIQPRIGLGANIVFHTAERGDSGILGNQTSPVLDLGLDIKISKNVILFGDTYYAITGNSDDENADSLAVVTGVGIQF